MRRWQLSIGIVAVIVIASLSFSNARRITEGQAPAFDDAAVRVRIDVSDRRLYLEENGEVTRDWSVTVGSSEHPTPRGSYAVKRIIWNPRWVPPDSEWAKKEKPRQPGDPKNPMGRVKIFFREPTYYVHGTNDEASLGTSASHGCIRMRNDDVIELAGLLIDHGGAPIEPGLIRRLLNNVRQTREIGLSDAIPLRVQT